jgi:hypothetical protein
VLVSSVSFCIRTDAWKNSRQTIDWCLKEQQTNDWLQIIQIQIKCTSQNGLQQKKEARIPSLWFILIIRARKWARREVVCIVTEKECVRPIRECVGYISGGECVCVLQCKCACVLQLCVYADAALTCDTLTLRLETAVSGRCHKRKASSTRRELPAARLERLLRA